MHSWKHAVLCNGVIRNEFPTPFYKGMGEASIILLIANVVTFCRIARREYVDDATI